MKAANYNGGRDNIAVILLSRLQTRWKMIKIGMMIGNRYEILEKIGTGGMSDVYKSKDHKLNRYVAVKVLKQEFSENANFVSKFQVEAQAAAGLAHPNVVNVYDVGEENDVYYIVMELVEGITLKKYIEKKQGFPSKRRSASPSRFPWALKRPITIILYTGISNRRT